MAALDSKYHIKIDGYGFILARMPRADRHIYGREEAPTFVNKFSSGDPNYRDSTFFPHWVQNNWLNGFDQEKWNDGGKYFRSSQVDPTTQEKLTLQHALDSVGTLSNQPKAFGIRTASSSQTWWDTNYSYRQQLTVTAPSGVALPQYHSVKVTIDTAALETASKVRSDRKDWRIIYWNGSSFVDLSRDYIDATQTWFAIQVAISAGQTDNNYFVYYGYSSESTTKQPSTDTEWNAVYGFFGATPDANTKAIYHMREGSGTAVNDDSTGTNNGTASGAPSWGTTGKFGRYLALLRSSSQYVDVGAGNDLQLGSMTIEFWLYLNGGGVQTLVSRWHSTDAGKAYRVQLDGSSKVIFIVHNGTTSATITGATVIANSSWYHIAVTYDGSSVAKIYVNGVLDATSTLGLAVNASTQKTYLGYSGDTTDADYMFNGYLQHVRISNSVRTSFPYVLTSEPSVSAGTETPQASAPSTGTFEVYAGDNTGSILKWDGATTWTEQFNARRLQWFDTVASGDTDYPVGDSADTEYAQAQSFQLATATKVKAVEVYIKKLNALYDLTVRIETNNAGVPSGTLADNNLATTVAVANVSSSYGWQTIEFTSPSTALSASTTYWLVLKVGTAAATNVRYEWKADASSPSYSSGNRAHSSNGGSSWTADAAADMLFRILAETTYVNQIIQATFSSTTKLWFATGDPTNTGNSNARLYTYDGTTWVLAKTFTGAGSAAALCLQVYNSKLYCGLCPTARIESTSDGSTWTAAKDIDEPNNPGYVWDMDVYNGRLYAAGGHPEYVITNNSQGFLYSYDDYTWSFVYNFDFTVIKCLCVFDSLLFLGTVDKRLYVYNTASMDKLFEWPWDVSINSMVVYDDKLAIGLGATNSLTGEEAVYLFDRNGFHKAFVPSGSVGINALIVARNQLLIGNTGTTIHKVNPDTYISSGTLQMSYFEASLPSIDKQWYSVNLIYESLPQGCSIAVAYKTDESNSSWTTVDTANTTSGTSKEMTFSSAFYSKKLSLQLTLATSDNTKTPTLKTIDVRYVTNPDFKYLWKMKFACPDNIMWLDGTEPISTTTTAIGAGDTSLPLTDAGGFPTKGRAIVVDTTDDEFTWTGKSGNTLTGVSGLLAHTSTGLVTKITGKMMHKQLLTLKQAKTFYTFTDIDELTYTVFFNNYQADDFIVNQDDGLENNVPITLLEA